MLDAFDPGFLEKEPLHGYFGALDHDTSHRSSKDDKFKLIILQLKENAWEKRVQRWLDLAFPPPLKEKNKKSVEIVVDDHTWLVFVKFQWALRQSNRQAAKFLSEARRNRSYIPPAVLARGSLPPAPAIYKRKRHPGSRRDVVSKAVRRPRKRTCPRKNKTRAKANTKELSMPLNPMIVDHPNFSGECSPGIISTDDCRMEESGEAYVQTETSLKEQSVDPMFINSPSCPSNFEQWSAFTDGIEPPPQLGETVFNHRSKPMNRQDMMPVNIPISVSNTGSPVDSFTCRAVSNTTVPVFHTISDGKPVSNIGVDTFAAASLDSSMIENESEHNLGSPVPPNISLACLEQSFPMDGESFGWLYDDLSNGPMVLYHGEETEIHFPARYGESQRFTVIDVLKEPLRCYPPMWAQSRQEICESFGWFRSYQGGVYYTREIVKGYLLGGFSASRDRFEHDGRLIISHGGGKAASVHYQKGQSFRTTDGDQLAQDKSVRALLRTFKECRPIVLVIDDRYASFPFDLSAKGVSYAVLGFYTIAHAWAEYQPAQNEQGCVVRYKFAFRWCEGQGEPWWSQEDNRAPMATSPKLVTPSRRLPVKLTEQALTRIKLPLVPSHVYLHCPGLWREVTKGRTTRRLPDRLDYDPKFLELTNPFVLNEALVKSLNLSMPISAPNKVITSYASTKGWHCNQCGRLSCRDKWEKYECPNCRYSVSVSRNIRSSAALRRLHVPVPFQDPLLFKNFWRHICWYKPLPMMEVAARIHHVEPSHCHINEVSYTILRPFHHTRNRTQMKSSGSIRIKRWLGYYPFDGGHSDLTNVGIDLDLFLFPVIPHTISPPGRGSLLTNYFSQNTGVPYQYVGGTANTLAWDKAPGAVINARRMIECRVSMALKRPVQFNEVLSAAYMERQRMATLQFHSDSEPGLGPLVAGLSLGSPALMHFRLLAKHEPAGEQRQIAMTFVLRHGDILVMDGAQVQEYYEHTVIPSNFRIAATARFISNDHPDAEGFHIL
ncbi:hypothetical protein F5887DRAFT_1280766 [Amanita rubescens]|nr:hypothetical protein F5887DRAFT_1280766 [Amanita rubescens]